MNKLRTGDEVIVISGKDKGKTGTLTKFISKDKCIVMGLKLVKKHQKPNPQLNIAGGIIEKEAPIHLSNIAIYNKKTKKADKVKIIIEEKGKNLFWRLVMKQKQCWEELQEIFQQ